MTVKLRCNGCYYKPRADISTGAVRYIFVPNAECQIHGVGAIHGHIDHPDAAWTDLGGEG